MRQTQLRHLLKKQEELKAVKRDMEDLRNYAMDLKAFSRRQNGVDDKEALKFIERVFKVCDNRIRAR